LGFNEVSARDNFFDLGDRFLKLTQVISRVRQAFQFELPLARVFQASTIAILVALVEKLLGDHTASTQSGASRFIIPQKT